MVVVLSHDLTDHGPMSLLSWPLVGVIASASVGTILVQDAFASGSLPTAVTAMTIADPVSSGVVGTFLFDVTRPSGLELWLGLPLVAALIITGVTLLATSTTLHDERHLHDGTLPPVQPRKARAAGSSPDRAPAV
jgi:hypothetical protein